VERINLYTTFDTAAKLGQYDLLEQMLVDGVGVNATDQVGHSLLHWAVEQDHLQAARLLLKYGADIDLRDRNGKSAYHLAKEKDKQPFLTLFKAHRHSA
jgi:ankyrin repeat protein